MPVSVFKSHCTRQLVAGFVGTATALSLLASACTEIVSDSECSSIPPGGCPLSRGVACEDPSCEAVYACRPGNVWELDHACPIREASAPRDAAVDHVPDASSERDGNVPDAPPGANGGPGCGALQLPDCALGMALSCPSGCCDCEDLFVCRNGGWISWGVCSVDGGVHP